MVIASNSQSLVAAMTPLTIRSGVSCLPEGNLRGVSCPDASTLTFVPPTSITRTFMTFPSLGKGCLFRVGRPRPLRATIGRQVLQEQVRRFRRVRHAKLSRYLVGRSWLR